MTGRVTKFMRWLKASVIVMGILIVAGTAAIAVMLAMRAEDDGAAGGVASGEGASGGAASDGASSGVVAGAGRLVLPAGARVMETALDGDRIALRIGLAGGGQRVVVIDARTGRRIGTVDVVPAAAERRK